jgi:isocitrate dehydrogenase
MKSVSSTSSPVRIAVAKGDGIGPEIMEAVLGIFQAAGVDLTYQFVEMGKQWFEKGISSGMPPETKDIVEHTGILFKGPMETPKGKGVKSLNVTARKVWNTYANKRVFKTLPGVDTLYSRAGIPVDITIVRENIEDTYGGIEHRLTHDVALCRRFITRPGSLQVHRYAFETARRKGTKKIVCGHKANIMKLTDGLFLDCFYEVARDYPELEVGDIIVDDLAMKLVTGPQHFEVVVLPNLQGDIISDLCAGLVGGLGFAPSANIGDYVAIFEAVHGTAPDIAGKNRANPTALLLSGTMLLRHVGLTEKAVQIEESLLTTLKSGIHTADVGTDRSRAASTKAFAEAIIQNLREELPEGKRSVEMPGAKTFTPPPIPAENRLLVSLKEEPEKIVGVDLFIESDRSPEWIAGTFEKLIPAHLRLITISNRGTQVWPAKSVFTDCINQYRVRVESNGLAPLAQSECLEFAQRIALEIKICSLEMLMQYGDHKGYTLAQGQ